MLYHVDRSRASDGACLVPLGLEWSLALRTYGSVWCYNQAANCSLCLWWRNLWVAYRWLDLLPITNQGYAVICALLCETRVRFGSPCLGRIWCLPMALACLDHRLLDRGIGCCCGPMCCRWCRKVLDGADRPWWKKRWLSDKCLDVRLLRER